MESFQIILKLLECHDSSFMDVRLVARYVRFFDLLSIVIMS